VLRKFLASYPHGNVFLGDNGGRPTLLRFPDFHRDIIGGPLKILRGSDPLPLPAEADRVGSFGFTLREHMDLLRPAESLKRILLMPDVEPAVRTRTLPFATISSSRT
jgi:hypothetical protein